MKKKFLVLSLVVFCVLTGCGKNNEEGNNRVIGKYIKYTKNYESYDITLKDDGTCKIEGYDRDTSADRAIYYSPFFENNRVVRECKYKVNKNTITMEALVTDFNSEKSNPKNEKISCEFNDSNKTITCKDKTFTRTDQDINVSDGCEEELVKYVRECVGCANPKEVAIYKSSCGGHEYYYDKYHNKHNYYVNSIDWSLIN